MARTINMAVLVVVGVLAAALLQGTEAATYTVGESTGWIDPTSNTTLYTAWVTGKSFAVGDILVFNFNTGAHDVATVTQAVYDACTTSNTLSLITAGPASITLNTTGEHYYICTIGNHCATGQKLAINVISTNSTSGSPPGSPPPPPPPPSSASSVVATFSVIFMSIVIGLSC